MPDQAAGKVPLRRLRLASNVCKVPSLPYAGGNVPLSALELMSR